MNVSRRTWLIQVTANSFLSCALAPTVFAQIRPRRVVEVQINNRKVITPPAAIKLTEGDLVELRWTSDEKVELHLHGYDLKLIVVPGEPGAMAFRAFASGRFPITSHGWGSGGHSHDALTYLEVYPQ
jgi:FtsP/CotA-like multicopper oxidase with cupredoxin domain